MDLLSIVKYLFVAVSVFLIISILLQNRGGGLGTIFGGSGGGEYYRSRRGVEAFLYNSTIILSIIFAILALAIAILS